jgi:hypothetical protein
MMAFALSLLLFTPNAFAGDDPADCPPQFMEKGIYNMKNRWFGGCKTKCDDFCEVDGVGGINFPKL